MDDLFLLEKLELGVIFRDAHEFERGKFSLKSKGDNNFIKSRLQETCFVQSHPSHDVFSFQNIMWSKDRVLLTSSKRGGHRRMGFEPTSF